MPEAASPRLRSILVVDDEPGIRRAVTRALSDEGYQVTSAQDVPSAIAALECRSFSAVLTDLQMPGPPGLVLVEEVERRGLLTPVILMTGSPGAIDDQDPRVDRLAGMVAKPFRLSMLRRLIPTLIDASS